MILFPSSYMAEFKLNFKVFIVHLSRRLCGTLNDSSSLTTIRPFVISANFFEQSCLNSLQSNVKQISPVGGLMVYAHQTNNFRTLVAMTTRSRKLVSSVSPNFVKSVFCRYNSHVSLNIGQVQSFWESYI